MSLACTQCEVGYLLEGPLLGFNCINYRFAQLSEHFRYERAFKDIYDIFITFEPRMRPLPYEIARAHASSFRRIEVKESAL